MYKRKTPVTLECGLDLVGEVLYGKWKMRLLYFIHQGYERPSELHRKIPDASPRVLFMQLKELEEHRLLERTVYPQVPLKVEYRLTEVGKTLIPLIHQLGSWADEHDEFLRPLVLGSIRAKVLR